MARPVKNPHTEAKFVILHRSTAAMLPAMKRLCALVLIFSSHAYQREPVATISDTSETNRVFAGPLRRNRQLT